MLVFFFYECCLPAGLEAIKIPKKFPILTKNSLVSPLPHLTLGTADEGRCSCRHFSRLLLLFFFFLACSGLRGAGDGAPPQTRNPKLNRAYDLKSSLESRTFFVFFIIIFCSLPLFFIFAMFCTDNRLLAMTARRLYNCKLYCFSFFCYLFIFFSFFFVALYFSSRRRPESYC